MRNTIAILKKELNVYLTTVVAYAGFGAFAFLMGLLFVGSVNRYQQTTQFALQQQRPDMLERLNFNEAIISPMLSTGIWMFLFFVPFLTMRLFAEEKSGRTFELLMSSPVRSIELVLGKFLSVTVMMMVMCSIPLLFPFILQTYGESGGFGTGVDWAPVWTGVGAVFLLGVSFCSMGLFFSSLTESQIVAALLTFAALLIGFVLPMMAGRLEGDWRLFLEYLSPIGHVGKGLEGRVHIKDVVYFLSVIFGFVFLTHRAVESHRWR